MPSDVPERQALNSPSASFVLQPRALLSKLKSDAVLRNSAIYLTGSVLTGLLGYVFHFETGHLLGPGAYSVVASAIAALYLLTLPVIGLQLVSARFASVAVAQDRANTILPMLIRLTAFSLLGGLPVAAVLAVFSSPVARFLNLSDHRVVFVLALAGLSSIVITINRGALQGLRRFVALSGNMMLDMASRLALAGTFIIVGFGALGAITAVALGPVLAYVQSVLYLRHAGGAVGHADRSTGIGQYAILATVASVGINYLFSIDTLLAKHYLAPEAAGLYAAASVLARVIYFLGLSVAGVMFPEVANLHARNEAHFHVVDRSLLLVTVMGVGLIALYGLFPGLVLFPYGPSFSSARSYLGVFAIALTMLTIANLFINYFLSIARRAFVIPLFGACVAETVLLTMVHSGIWQILTVVVFCLGLLAALMAALYAWDRFASWRTST
jgi:O-antigen/teichoic acid export membrane protein